jgi:tetratricopeptide (TPR) repeat protein
VRNGERSSSTNTHYLASGEIAGTPSHRSARRGFNTHQLLVFVVILYFTFIGGSFYSDFNFSLRVFNQVVVTGILGGWLFVKLRRGDPFPRTALDIPILAWLIVLFISAIFGLSPRFSLEKTWTSFTLVLAFYLLVDLRRNGYSTTVARAFYMSAAVVCLVGLAEFGSWYFGLPLLSQSAQGWPAIGGLEHPFPPTLYRLNFTLNGATPLSAYLALLIPPALGILVTTRDRDDRQAIVVWLALAFIVEGLSFSRGGILALLVSLPLTALGWLVARRSVEQVPKGSRTLRRFHLLVIIVILVALLIVASLLGPSWLKRTFLNRDGSTQFRFTLWDVALSTFLEHPINGVGPYNFGRSLLQRNDPALPRLQIMTAHNVYLNTAAELGLIGLLVGGWMLLAAGRAWLTRWRGTPTSTERVLVAATGAALVGFAAQSLVDTFTAMPIVLPVLAVAAFALTDSSSEARHVDFAQGALRPRLPTALAFLAVMLYAAGLAWLDLGQYHFQQSANLAKRGDLAGAVMEAEQARQLDGTMPLYTFQLAYLLGQMTDQPEALGRSIELYRTGLFAEPVDGRQTANLAAVLWQTRDHQKAIDTLAQAVTLEPDPLWLVNLGYFYQQVGDWDRAIEAYGQALALSPTLASSGFWQKDTELAARWPDILAQAEAKLAEKGSDLAIWRLLVTQARQDWPAISSQLEPILEGAPWGCHTLSLLAWSQFEMGNVDEADRLAQQAIDAAWTCSIAQLVQGLVNEAKGNLSAAELGWRTAFYFGQSDAAYYLGQLYQRQGDTSTAAHYYKSAISPSVVPVDVEITLYDRNTSFDMLPPLFRIGVGPQKAEPWLALGRIYEAEEDFEAARLVYETVLLQDPFLVEAQERLDALPSSR